MKTACLVIASFLALGCSALASPQLDTIRRDIEHAYQSEDAALGRGDAQGGAAFHAKNFVQTERGHSETLPQYIATMTQALQESSFSGKTKVVDVQVTSDGQAVVRVVQHADIVVRKTGRKLNYDGTARDTWVKQGNAWHCSHSEVLTDKVTEKP